MWNHCSGLAGQRRGKNAVFRPASGGGIVVHGGDGGESGRPPSPRAEAPNIARQERPAGGSISSFKHAGARLGDWYDGGRKLRFKME